MINLMEALKRSLARDPKGATAEAKPKARQDCSDRRQPALLMPVSGGREKKRDQTTEPAAEPAHASR